MYLPRWKSIFLVARKQIILTDPSEVLRILLTLRSVRPWKYLKSQIMRSRGVSIFRASRICAFNS